MIKPVRLQLSRRKSFKLQALSRAPNGLAAVSVTRPHKYGNPFTITFCRNWFGCGIAEARKHAVRLHKEWLAGTLGDGWVDKKPPPLEEVRADLAGRNIPCACGLGKECHGDNLLEIANA